MHHLSQTEFGGNVPRGSRRLAHVGRDRNEIDTYGRPRQRQAPSVGQDVPKKLFDGTREAIGDNLLRGEAPEQSL